MKVRFRLAAVMATVVACAGLSLAGAGPASAATNTVAGFALANYSLNGSTPMCMTGGSTNSAPVSVEPCNGSKYGAQQAWHWLDPFGTGRYAPYSQLADGSGKCLGVSAGSNTQGSHLVTFTCKTGHFDQYWEVLTQYSCSRTSMNTFYPIDNDGSGLVIGTNAGSMKDGTALIIYHYQFKCNNQDWGGAED